MAGLFKYFQRQSLPRSEERDASLSDETEDHSERILSKILTDTLSVSHVSESTVVLSM